MDLEAVCQATGIEPSRIRFFEQEFRDFLPGAGGLALADAYDERCLELLSLINRRMFAEGRSLFDIRRELANRRQPANASLRVIAVTSGKGGVGKTTFALNLAVALARRGRRTLLIDADMGLGNVHVLAGLQPAGTVLDVIEGRASVEQILAEGPEGIQVLCGASGVPELADVEPRKLDNLMTGVSRLADRFDAVVIDTAAGISAQVTRFLRAADDIVVVTTPNIAATLDAYGLIKTVRQGNMPGRLHIMVNLALSNRQALSVYERLRDCAQRFLQCVPAHLGQLQRHGAVERANQNRRPLLLEAPHSLNAARLQKMADTLLALEPRAAATPAPRCLPLDLFLGGAVDAARSA